MDVSLGLGSGLRDAVVGLRNGPENQSHRTQRMQRLVDVVRHTRLHVRLAHYPPYHNKFNLSERCGGILENHGHGAVLDSVDAVIAYANS